MPETKDEAERTGARGGAVAPKLLLALLLLTLGGFALRAVGIGSMLPHTREIDSEIVDEAHALIVRGDWDPSEQDLNKYPTLLPWLAAFRALPPMAAADASLEEHLAAASALYLRMRWVVLLIAIGAIPGTWLLARRFLPDDWALVAAAFVAVGLIHADFSNVARPHGAVASFMLASVLASLRMRRAPTLANYALAGLAAGLAIGCLHNGVAILIPLGAAHLLREREAVRGRHRWRILLSLAIAAGCMAFFYWNLVEGLFAPAYSGVKRGALQQGEHHLTWDMFSGEGFGAMARQLLACDPVLAVMAVIGAALGLRAARGGAGGSAERRDAAVALAAALPYFLVLGIYSRTYARFLIPLFPYLAVLAAVATRALADACARRAVWKAALVALLLALPTLVCAKSAWLRSVPDTNEQVATWIRARAANGGARVALAPGVELPLFYPSAALSHPDGRPIGSGIWADYQRRLPSAVRDAQASPLLRVPYKLLAQAFLDGQPDASEVLRATGAEYVVYQHSEERLTRPDGRFFFESLEEHDTLELRFAPDGFDRAEKRRLTHVWTEDKAWRILDARALGPELRVYRLRAE